MRRDRAATVETEVVELHERVRLLTQKRADLAWKGLMHQVHTRSAAVVETLLSACRPSTLRRLVDTTCSRILTHLPEEGCVGELGVQLVAVTLRRHLEERKASSPAETEAHSASEHFGLFELRRHRAEIRRMFQSVKAELWTSVIEAALREAGAVVVRVEARCSEAELESLRGRLADAFQEQPNPCEVPGSELGEVAEYIAAEQVLASLGRRARRTPAKVARPRRAGAPRLVSPTGFEHVPEGSERPTVSAIPAQTLASTPLHFRSRPMVSSAVQSIRAELRPPDGHEFL